MPNALTKLAGLTAVLALLGGLAACGNLSQNVAKDGRGAGQLVWPTPNSTVPGHKGGTFPSVEALRKIQPGINKPQIAELIGYPHYTEGVWGVREWDYLFNFRKPGSSEISVCQYKILFDEHKLAQSFYWQPASCAELLEAKRTATPVATDEPEVRHYTLSSDVLFAFDKAAAHDILPHGREELDQLAGDLLAHRGHISSIQVEGYTDRLGSDAYNQQLSQQRAETVRGYLVKRGVPAETITAQGHGEADPVAQCEQGKQGKQGKRSELIACLAPNRRVEVVAKTH